MSSPGKVLVPRLFRQLSSCHNRDLWKKSRLTDDACIPVPVHMIAQQYPSILEARATYYLRLQLRCE